MLYQRKLVFDALTMFFLFTLAFKSKHLTLLKIKSPDLRSRLSLVDKVIEISNLELVKDLAKVIDIDEDMKVLD